ncbi:MAG: hypothetical protein PHI97_05570 [Desulfobulbus sp.]|nr:hypothetical protein [Desulfobulbus sp.]
MSEESLPLFLQTLLKPGCYDHPVAEVELVQTHISFVLLAGEFVYKFKKPVNFGFLDFSDLEKRQSCCQQELVLNRRLCPDIYLGLVTVTKEKEGCFALNGQGEVVEYGVKMARMPEERMMQHLIQRGELTAGHIDSLVRILASFYEQAEGGKAIAAFGTAESVAVNVLENFEQTQGFIDQGALSREQFDRISEYARSVLANHEIFHKRIDGGYIRDCHGDLYSANICLADKVYIFDCIEFNQRFRYCDVASDVAFLAMDLDFHGLDDFSGQFITQFCERTQDASLLTLLNFYKCYRAYVRGKIGLFTAADPAVAPNVQENCRQQAAQYFRLAERYAAE